MLEDPPVGGAVVKRDDPVYRPDLSDSFFADLWAAEWGQARGLPTTDATDRLTRHQAQMEQRTNPTTTLGQGGEFVPPAWLIAKWAPAARATRVVANRMNQMPLPAGVSTINVPKVTTNETTAIQAGQNAADSQTDMVTTSFQSLVVTIAGETVVSVQLLEQATPAGLDSFLYPDLVRDYDQRLELQLINGSGTNGQLTGLINIPNNILVTYTDGSPTAAKVVAVVGQACGQISDSKLLPPEVLFMSGRRWFYIETQPDQSLRPLGDIGGAARTYADGMLEQSGGVPPLGHLGGLPVYAAGGIPLTLGAGANQDPIIAARTSDMNLYEGTPKFSVMFNPLSGNLQARLQLRNYAAFVGQRFPASTAVVNGTGLVAPSGY